MQPVRRSGTKDAQNAGPDSGPRAALSRVPGDALVYDRHGAVHQHANQESGDVVRVVEAAVLPALERHAQMGQHARQIDGRRPVMTGEDFAHIDPALRVRRERDVTDVTGDGEEVSKVPAAV